MASLTPRPRLLSGRTLRLRSGQVVVVVEAPVDLRDLGDPLLPFTVFEPENLLMRPVKVIGDVRYFLAEPPLGVGASPPNGVTSRSNWCSQCGHCARTRLWP